MLLFTCSFWRENNRLNTLNAIAQNFPLIADKSLKTSTVEIRSISKMMQRVCNRIFSMAPRVSASASTSSSATYCTDNNRWVRDDRREGNHGISNDKTFVNSCTLVGNVGRDPEERGSDNVVAVFPLLTVHFSNYSDGQPTREFKHWHRILVAHTQQREKVLRQVRKGDKVYIDGSIKQSKLADGSYTSYILAERILRLNRNRGFNQEEQSDQQATEEEAPAEETSSENSEEPSGQSVAH